VTFRTSLLAQTPEFRLGILFSISCLSVIGWNRSVKKMDMPRRYFVGHPRHQLLRKIIQRVQWNRLEATKASRDPAVSRLPWLFCVSKTLVNSFIERAGTYQRRHTIHVAVFNFNFNFNAHAQLAPRFFSVTRSGCFTVT
jgi:hypothetical protein